MSGEVLSTGIDPYTHVLMRLGHAVSSCGWLEPEAVDYLWGLLMPRPTGQAPKKPRKWGELGWAAQDWVQWPLGVVLFGEGKNDPRRKEWCEVSGRWGFGDMKSLEDKAGISRNHRQRPGRMDGDEIRRVLAEICEAADRAGCIDEFDRWLEGRIRRPGDMFAPPSEEAEAQVLIEQAEDCLGAEGLRRLAEQARLLTMDPECVGEHADPAQLEAVRARVLTDHYRAKTPSVE